MKLVKYVMTHDSGLAPNPYFDICSLAVCTPNHNHANIDKGDWIVGHSTKATGYRLIYAMRVTRVLSLQEYFENFPQKRPDPYGSLAERYGDNFYYQEDGHWKRLPSAEHNDIDSFKKDTKDTKSKRVWVYLAEGKDNYWYFGAASELAEARDFQQEFGSLVRKGRNFQYVSDENEIKRFAKWLSTIPCGKIGDPRDQKNQELPPRFLIAINPETWIDCKEVAATPRIVGKQKNGSC
jgi:hypothetical protein